MATTIIRLKCDSIPYRKGFVEVSSGIHDGCINLETWDIDVDCDLSGVDWVSDEPVKDSDVNANTEIELSMKQARELGNALIAAADQLESKDQ